MGPKAKQVWVRQLDAARQAQIAVVVEILGELDYLRSDALELEPSLVAECVIRNVDFNGVIRDLEEAHGGSEVPEAPATGTQEAEFPSCPKCGERMAVRVVKNGPRAGARFLGCMAYPECKGTLPLES